MKYLSSALLMTLSVMPLQAQKARAVLVDSASDTVGTALLTQTAKGVEINLNIQKLDSGMYAFHIHEKGDCTPPDFKSAGPHFNPEKKEHGFLNPKGIHAGDLPNIYVDASKKLQKTLITNRVSLKKGSADYLLKQGGTALVIHKKPDDYISDPAGEAGDRIACGVIKPAESDTTKAK